MNLDDLNKQIQSIVDLQNNAPLDDFEGLSPTEMNSVRLELFQSDCPVTINDIDPKDESPFFNIVVDLLTNIQEHQPLKITEAGNLPKKLVMMIYDKKHITSKYDEYYSVNKEEDFRELHTANIISRLAKLVSIQKKKISLTKKGTQLLIPSNRPKLFSEVIKTFLSGFNIAYNDRYYDDEETGVMVMGMGFSLYLLGKHGNKEQLDEYYAKKYFQAFPILLQLHQYTFGSHEHS